MKRRQAGTRSASRSARSAGSSARFRGFAHVTTSSSGRRGAGGDRGADGAEGAVERAGDAPEPVVRRRQAVEAHGQAREPAGEERLERARREAPAVRDHPPGEPAGVDPIEDAVESRAAERLAARDHEDHLARVEAPREPVHDRQPLLGGELARAGLAPAVRPAVEAAQVAARGDLEEEVAQRVDRRLQAAVERVQQAAQDRGHRYCGGSGSSGTSRYRSPAAGTVFAA